MKPYRYLTLFTLLTLGMGTAGADSKHFYFQRAHQEQSSLSQLLQDTVFSFFPLLPPQVGMVTGSFDQRIDHDSTTDQRTFKQRYYVYSDVADSPTSPVLFYICGEATCNSSFIMGAILQQAKALRAHIIALEHRYYGKSIPTPDLSTANLRYLSTDYALKDLAAFQNFARQTLGIQGKVVTIGGSYPGSLSAYYRLKYPHLVSGALASSAPVRAKVDFSEYDAHVARVAEPVCAAALRDVSSEIEKKLSDPSESKRIRGLFDALFSKNDTDFLYLIADVGAAAIQYGQRDKLCGMIASPGLSIDQKIVKYSDFAKNLYHSWGVTAFEFSLESAFSLNPADYIKGFGLRAWLYQSCTEYGYFQNAHSDPFLTARSARINAAYHRDLCERLFEGAPFVNEAQTNQMYYEPLLDAQKTSNILYTNGSDDPWNKLSITPELGNDTNPKTVSVVIPGAAHCDDMGRELIDDSFELKSARQTFLDSASIWAQ